LGEGGTIFLDENGELPAETQIALLRVLQEHELERVGGTGSIRTDVRLIAATNRDLEAAIAAGMFQSDLLNRLNVFPIEILSLRERREDIPLLVEYFIDRYARKAGKSFLGVNKKSLDLRFRSSIVFREYSRELVISCWQRAFKKVRLRSFKRTSIDRESLISELSNLFPAHLPQIKPVFGVRIWRRHHMPVGNSCV